MVIVFHRNLLSHLNWVIMSESDSNLVMDYFRLVNRNDLRSRLSHHIFFRNGDHIIHNFLDVFGHFYDFWDGPEHIDNQFNLIQFNSLGLNHPKHSLI